MTETSGETLAVWPATAEMPSALPLRENMRAEVCIVGAGIAGLTTAYLLAREGRSVVVLDDGRIGGGMTERTTAHLSCAIDDRYAEIERLHGEEGARLAAASHAAAIDRIEQIVGEEGIDCDFERLDGYLFVPPGENAAILDDELQAARRAGLAGVELVARAPLSFDTGPCLRFPRQGQFHPLKYLAGLAHALERLGGRIFTGSHATAMSGGDQAQVKTAGGFTVQAQAIVIATNTPINDLVTIHTKQAPYTTYVVGARVPSGSVARALYWDTADPYHYVRLQGLADCDLLIVGGEDHKTGQADDGDARHGRLLTWAKKRFPTMGETLFRWSGQVMEPVDGMAFIGRNPGDPDNVYIVTGDSGMGMTHGTIGGMLITDLIAGRQNPWTELYDPSRKSLRAIGRFIQENINVSAQYVGGLLSGGDVASLDEIAPDHGAVIRRGLKKIAVYRDGQGVLTKRSALCPHLGCIVSWNSLEKTWDCPCHGSRYDRFGRVINGPANKDLAPLDED